MNFTRAARASLGDTQLRRNLARATSTIRDKRSRAVEEVPDWEALRAAGARIKDRALLGMDVELERLEAAVLSAGGHVHWANDGDQATAIIARIAQAKGIREVVKVKSITSDEIELNKGLADAGVQAIETDLAELIVQLGDDVSSHILVPAIHKNRAEIRDLFRRRLQMPHLSDDPAALAEAARLHLRRKFLSARMAVSGANFAVAETGAVCVVESEGNGRMCTTLPEVLVTLMGVEKIVSRWRDMEVLLQLLPRSATGERMNPYTSFWTGTRQGDGPQEFHLVLLDNGRVATLADEVGRQALRCIRCSACLNVCPVYTRVGGHAYGSVYPGPIGAIIAPQLRDSKQAASLPYASTLCGACEDVCPVKIEIPRILRHLRARERAEARWLDPERLSMNGLYRAFSTRKGYERAQKLARLVGPQLAHRGALTAATGPLSGWTKSRDLPAPAAESFREWWRRSRGPEQTGEPAPTAAPAHQPRRTTRQTHSPSLPSRPDSTGSPDSRALVLSRIRAAIDGAESPAPGRPGYRTHESRSHEAVIRLFISRIADYRATVERVDASTVSAAVAAHCEGRSLRNLGIAPDLPHEWRTPNLDLVVDARLPVSELDALDGALTGCAAGVAQTGTVVLDGGVGQGRRALTLIPDLHICVVRTDQIVGLIPEAIRRLEPAARSGQSLTFISGPSATSDIELDRVEGVHGPRSLHVIVAG